MFFATLPARTLAAALLLALPHLALAQAPVWQLALSGNNSQPGTGGTSQALATAINGAGDVFVTGSFSGTVAFGATRLTSAGAAGTTDVFVAKWSASAQAFTWALSGGGTGNDTGRGITVRNASVYVTGDFASNSGATLAGQALTGAGGQDVFVAKYYDTSSGSTPATSSYANGWATSAGGAATDVGYGVAVSSTGVFVTGLFTSGTGATIAGKTLPGAGSTDVFVAKYADTSTGTTPATSSFANGWVASGGGSGADVGYALAVRGTGVFVTGAFASGAASFAGQALSGAGSADVFVAKYNDTSSGATPATSSFGDAWAVSGGGTGLDAGYGLAVNGTSVYVTGYFTSGAAATLAGQALTGAGGLDAFVAKYNDTSTGSTPATSSVDTGWALSGGGPGNDSGLAVAVSGTGVYATGSFASTGATVAGQALTSAGATDVFVAKYTDTSTGTTAATSSYANTWAVSGGGTASDAGVGVAVGTAAVYLAGQVGAADASFGTAPAKVYAPASSAVLGTLNLTNGAWLQADGPLQGGLSTTRAIATDASGNVFVTGEFTGTVGFGSTRLVSAGSADVFVAKWDGTAQAYTWTTSGGGPGDDRGQGVAVRGAGVYVTGYFTSGGASFAGKALAGAGDVDVFVAKYLDTSTGNTPAASSFANGWAVSAGGTGPDLGYGVAVSNTGVYVTGTFLSASAATIAGKALAGAGAIDAFVAKYIDTSTGNTTATSSYQNGWATSAGGTGPDLGYGVAASGTSVYVTGTFFSASAASVAGVTLPGAGNADIFVAKYIDTSTGNTTATSSFANGWAVGAGGTASDAGNSVAVSGKGVYVAGSFGNFGGSPASVAGAALTSAGNLDMFVAKYIDTSTGNTTATSSVANGWATSAGGTDKDQGTAVAVSGTAVFVGGTYASSSLSLAGQTLGNAGSNDLFAAKYVDTSTGSTPATSSFANAWATSGGGAGFDGSYGLAVSGQQVYAAGIATPPAAFGPATLTNAASGNINLLARLTDATLTPLAGRPGVSGAAGLALYPNPAHGAATLTGAAPGTLVQVLDVLGREVATATTGADGTAVLTGLAPGVYVVRAGTRATRLAVE